MHRRGARDRILLGTLGGFGERLAGVAVGLADLVEQSLEGELHVADDRVAHRRPPGLVGVGGDLDQRRAVRQQGARDVRVVREDRGADDQDQVAAGERLRHRPDRRRQHAAEVGVALGEPDPPASRRRGREHRQALALGERDRRLPAAARVDVGAGDQNRVGGRLQPPRELGDGLRVADRPAAGPPRGHRPGIRVVDVGLPVVHRDRDERGPLRRHRRQVGGPGERQGDVLGAGRLVAPLDQRVRHAGRVAVGQVGLDGDERAALLSRRDHQRRVVGLGVEDRPHRVADPGRGVQIDQRRASAGLRVAVGHPDHDRLLEPEDVVEVVGEVLEHRQLRRPRVPEHRRHPVGAEEVEGGFADAAHGAGTLWGAQAPCNRGRKGVGPLHFAM